MGYKTSLHIGIKGHTSKDGVYFMTYANIDLGKLGDCSLAELQHQNKDRDGNQLYFWYETGREESQTKDAYGDIPMPIPATKVIEALKKDIAEYGFTRAKWALVLLESMVSTQDNLMVLITGY